MSDALESEDAAFVADALGVVARARGMSEVARESLYRSLSADGNPEFATVLRIIRALGLQISATPVRREKSSDKLVSNLCMSSDSHSLERLWELLLF